MRTAASILLAAVISLGACAPSGRVAGPAAAGTIPVDDSYTVSQRYDANVAAHPEFALPVVEAGEGKRILFDRRYKRIGARELHLDLFLAAPGPRPAQAVMLIHGGAWRSGNKSNFYALAQRLAAAGYAVVLPEFRLSPEAPYPAAMQDVNDAFVFIRDHAAEYGIDPLRIAVGGESSGGQMAALLAYAGPSGLYAASPTMAANPVALIDIDGVLDFTTPLALRYENAAGDRSVAAQWLGGSWERRPGRWREASAANHVGSQAPPTLVISGEDDRFTSGREPVLAHLRANDIANRHVHFPGLPHAFWLFDPYVVQVAAAIDTFLREIDGEKAVVIFEASKSCAERPRCFATVSEAIAAAEASSSSGRLEVRVGPGQFEERVRIARDGLVVSGAGAGQTRIFQALAAEHAGKFYPGNWGTPGSATVAIAARRVTLRDLTVENTFDYLANDALSDTDPGKIGNSQAVALLLDTGSDQVLAERVHLLGYQDTLFAKGDRAVIRDSLIAGNVDFIFGAGKLLIENSELRTRRRARREQPFDSFLLAPSTQLSSDVGILVVHSRLTREDGVPDASVALARPWHPTTNFPDGRYADPNAVGMAIFVDCYMDGHIHPDHWASMPGTARDGTKTMIFQPQDARFYASGSNGPGATARDIGMRWTPPIGIAALRSRIMGDWANLGE